MKTATFIIIAALSTSTWGFSQSSTDGTIIMKNAGVLTTSGTAYNVPIYIQTPGFNGGAGLIPGGFTIGLFTLTGTTPLATGQMGTTPQTAPFIVTPLSQTVTVTGYQPGSTPALVIRGWQTAAGSFDAARALGYVWSEWTFTTLPLGGTPPGGGLPITSPTFTGWGDPAGTGFTILTIPEPSTITLAAFGLGILTFRLRQRKFARAI